MMLRLRRELFLSFEFRPFDTDSHSITMITMVYNWGIARMLDMIIMKNKQGTMLYQWAGAICMRMIHKSVALGKHNTCKE